MSTPKWAMISALDLIGSTVHCPTCGKDATLKQEGGELVVDCKEHDRTTVRRETMLWGEIKTSDPDLSSKRPDHQVS